MRNEEIKSVLKVSGFIYAGLIAMLIKRGTDLLTFDGIKTALSVFTVIPILWGVYFKCGWKYKYLKRLLHKENINGTWFGKYESIDLTKVKEDEKLEDVEPVRGEISLVIKQSYLKTKIISRTEKYDSFSYSERLEKSDEKHKLVYVYTQDQDSVSDHSVRKGTSDLELVLSENNLKLNGKFWTNKGTIGLLKVERVSMDHCDTFKRAKELRGEN